MKESVICLVNFDQITDQVECLVVFECWKQKQDLCFSLLYVKIKKKGADLIQSYNTSPYINRNVEMAKWQHNATKSSIKQRLRTDLGRSVGVTKAFELVWFTGFTGPTHRNSCVIQDKNMHILLYSYIKVV